MSSKKEEERNEKIIRGLMKLPPNRRCINCNSLGPQYVCTNFWTFVCMTCSGIHREFTHRVKSVSMAKFTAQEVEALQKGGNQRAKEIFLKEWDPQRQRLPDSSNAEKVREFLKNVYVERRYAGGKACDKPPRDMQNLRHDEEETRRASSYHSYSQSPPYDYQYEERRYGKHTPTLSRKPGSDRGLYEGRSSSFFSPSRFNDNMHGDSFANEGSNPRQSDYSASSTGDPSRSDTQSPNFQRDIGFSSPPYQTSRDILNHHLQLEKMSTFPKSNTKADADRRTASLGSFGSFDDNSMSIKSVDSLSLADVESELEQSAGTHQDKLYAVPSLQQSSVSGNFGGLDLFNAPFVQQTVPSTLAVDLFQLPQTPVPPAVDLFQPSSTASPPNLHAYQPSQTNPSSLDLTSKMPQLHPAATLDKKLPDEVVSKNEGWATFDVPQPIAPNLGFENSISAVVPPADGGSFGKFEPLLVPSTSLQWPAFEDNNAPRHSPMPNIGHEGPVQVSDNATSSQSWNAFEDSTGYLPRESIQQSSEEVVVHAPSAFVNHYFGDFNMGGIQTDAFDRGPLLPCVNESPYAPSSIPSVVGAQSYATDHKSTNPFDLPCDSDFESSSMFLDMSSLQAALPSGQIPDSFLDGVTHPWFPQNPGTVFCPSAQQGALAFMGGQAPSTQIPNVPTQGSVASVGGNPFA